jgi:hypothetical protein
LLLRQQRTNEVSAVLFVVTPVTASNHSEFFHYTSRRGTWHVSGRLWRASTLCKAHAAAPAILQSLLLECSRPIQSPRVAFSRLLLSIIVPSAPAPMDSNRKAAAEVMDPLTQSPTRGSKDVRRDAFLQDKTINRFLNRPSSLTEA